MSKHIYRIVMLIVLCTETVWAQSDTTVSGIFKNESFNVNELAKILNLSKSQFNVKLKKQSTKTGIELIESIRLNQAKSLLVTSEFNISEIANTTFD